ncbi:MAG: hypothetical protein M3P12_00105, partial [Gemmatimonadota bacterium]|nr:hypothetical protein [Gemmatimonadota bacterium]
LSCRYGAGLSVVSALRMQGKGLRYRDISTAEGKKKVSVLDGYRLMLSQGEPSYFANMKIEKSDPRQYASDKDVVIKSLEYAMQATPPGLKPVWDHVPYNGFDVYSVTDTTMGANGPNGMYVLFRDSTQTIVTIYFLGQKPEHRHFGTIREHDAIVDKMIEDLTTCGNRPVAVAAGNLLALRTPDDLDRFINTYYLQPRPERIPEAMRMLTSSGVLQIAEAVGTITGFFSEIFLTNPSHLAVWQPVIDAQPGFAKTVLDRSLSWSKAGGVLQLPGRTAQMNEFYWGAFFASGNLIYVKKLLELAPLAAERNDFNLWTIGSTAKWSLTRNARQHPLVRTILEREKRTVDKPTQDIIDEVLTRDPQRMQREMLEFRNRQIRAGKWE